LTDHGSDRGDVSVDRRFVTVAVGPLSFGRADGCQFHRFVSVYRGARAGQVADIAVSPQGARGQSTDAVE
jgi:hypothetical protein